MSPIKSKNEQPAQDKQYLTLDDKWILKYAKAWQYDKNTFLSLKIEMSQNWNHLDCIML